MPSRIVCPDRAKSSAPQILGTQGALNTNASLSRLWAHTPTVWRARCKLRAGTFVWDTRRLQRRAAGKKDGPFRDVRIRRFDPVHCGQCAFIDRSHVHEKATTSRIGRELGCRLIYIASLLAADKCKFGSKKYDDHRVVRPKHDRDERTDNSIDAQITRMRHIHR